MGGAAGGEVHRQRMAVAPLVAGQHQASFATRQGQLGLGLQGQAEPLGERRQRLPLHRHRSAHLAFFHATSLRR